MGDYRMKENYITVNPEPEKWKHHANYHIIQHYSDYIKGACGDLGCNHAACTVFLLEWKERIHEIVGVDYNLQALDVAFHLALQLDPQIPINFVAANLVSLPFVSDKFDFLMSFHTLEHIYPQDVDSFIKEIFRVLKPGGHLLISIPYDHAYPDPAHVGFYTEDDLMNLFEKWGFYTVECMKDDRWFEKDLLTGLFQKPYFIVKNGPFRAKIDNRKKKKSYALTHTQPREHTNSNNLSNNNSTLEDGSSLQEHQGERHEVQAECHGGK